MLHLIQIMNHMLFNLDYSVDEVRDIFFRLQSDQTTIHELIYAIGLKPLTTHQVMRIEAVLPKWQSALRTLMILRENKAA